MREKTAIKNKKINKETKGECKKLHTQIIMFFKTNKIFVAIIEKFIYNSIQ